MQVAQVWVLVLGFMPNLPDLEEEGECAVTPCAIRSFHS
jgi:hypothetical protein